MTVAEVPTEFWLFGGAGLISVVAFVVLILVPTLGSFGRPWEKAAASFLSLFVLATLVLVGVAIGIAIVYYYPELSHFFGGD
ncbi:MAG TPA: hypothetical protein VKA89_07370 [Solirubrobacterales bacterium]|nr:hypothetical protein [Solirubrobacterales bacterium]